MKKSKFTDTQIIRAIKAHEGGRRVEDICREMGVSRGTFFKWKSKYGGMEASDVKRLKELEEENTRLKRMYAEAAMDNQVWREIFAKKGWALPQKGS